MADIDLDSVQDIITELLTVGQRLGIFDSVQGHEPKAAPSDHGLHLAMHGVRITPVPEVSGAGTVSVRLEFQLGVMTNMLGEPQDGIEPEVMGAAGMLMAALAGGFTLHGEAMAVDLLGAYGEGLRAEAGYVSIGGGQGDGAGTRLFRIMNVFVPVILADCWVVAA